MTEDKRICAECVQEQFLSAQIAASNVDDKGCDYCERTRPTLSISDVATACDEVIETYFTLTSMTSAVIYYDRPPKGESLLGMLDAWLTPDDQRATYDVAEILGQRWDSEEGGRYGEDPWFVKGPVSAWGLSGAWGRMERSLREEARLVNPMVVETLDRVFGGLAADRTEDGRSVIIEIGPGRSIDILYRARVFEHDDALLSALKNPESELGPPGPTSASAGRMNAKGVSVMYGAIEPSTALREVRPPVGSNVVVAAFKLILPLRLLDLPALSAARVDGSLSLFDPATRPIAERCDFINTLEAELTRPVLPSFADGEYLITQAIADYLSTHPHLDLDGIFFRSVQSREAANDAGGHNVILFHKASAVKYPDVKATRANLLTQVDEDEWEGPSITTIPHRPDTSPLPPWDLYDGREPTLELLRDSFVIHHVEGIDVRASTMKVEHKVAWPPKQPLGHTDASGWSA